MNRARHPPDSMIALYATGQLAPSLGLTVAAHLRACVDCAKRAESIEEAEGRLMASLPDAPLNPATIDAALSRLPAAPTREAPSPRLGDVTLPDELAAAGFGGRRWLAPGFWAARSRTPDAEGWRLVLLRAPAGARLPTHSHRSEELVVVLAGAFDDQGARFSAGDFVTYPAETTHAPKVTPDGPCACLIATREPSHWHGLGGLGAAWLRL